LATKRHKKHKGIEYHKWKEMAILKNLLHYPNFDKIEPENKKIIGASNETFSLIWASG
jgi:hypothetical protein